MMFEKNRLNISNINIFSICLLVALIPFATAMLSYAIILWLISSTALLVFQEKKSIHFKFDLGLVYSIALYLIFVIGVFYSQNISSAIFDIQIKLSLLLLPLVIYLLRDFYKKYYNFILLVFVFANVVAGLFCIGTAIFHSASFYNGSLLFNSNVPGVYSDVNTDAPSYFSYTNLSLFRHPSYYSMYLILCVFIIIYFFNNSYYFLKNKKSNYLLYGIMLVFTVILVYLLKSKTAYATLILLSILYFIIYAIIKKKKIISAVIVCLIILLSIIGYKHNSRFYYVNSIINNRHIMVDAIQKKDFQFIIDRFGIDRIPIWILSTEIIKEHFIFGVGSGDVKDNLISKYKKYNLHSLEENKYNTHNQYLETFIAVGIVGFVIFMAWLLYPLFLRKNYNRTRFLILIFSVIIVMNFLFEAVLNTIAGVIFVAFFYSFLLFVSGKIHEIKKI